VTLPPQVPGVLADALRPPVGGVWPDGRSRVAICRHLARRPAAQ
jgi:hypothetical protein